MDRAKPYRFILSGGGTGGHIFPALAIADELGRRLPGAEFLFIGAIGKMEMEKIPKAGYDIIGLPITGIQRSLSFENLKFPFRLVQSIIKARKTITEFKPDLVIGTGGFASGPTGLAAQQLGVSTVIQEQNSFPGITNKRLGKKAKRVFVAYENMDQYFPETAIRLTGNPVRSELFERKTSPQQAKAHFGLDVSKPVLFSVGGSLGSRTLNQVWINHAKHLVSEGYQLLWQTGSLDYESIPEELKSIEGVRVLEFIYEMDQAYSAADVIVSRAGAIAISELSIVGKPIILVPFPFAAEDHQTKNAQALVDNQAAIMISDSVAPQNLAQTAIELLRNKELQHQMSQNLIHFARPNATKDIVNHILNLLEE